MPNRPKKWRPGTGVASKRGGGSVGSGGLLSYVTGANKIDESQPTEQEGVPTYQARHPFLDALLNRGQAGQASMAANMNARQSVADSALAAQRAMELEAYRQRLSMTSDVQKEMLRDRLLRQREAEQAAAQHANALAMAEKNQQLRMAEEKAKAEAKQAAEGRELGELGNAAYIASKGPAMIYPNESREYSPREMALIAKHGDTIGKGSTGIATGIESNIRGQTLSQNRDLVAGDIIDKIVAARAMNQLNTAEAMPKTAFLGNPANAGLLQDAMRGEQIKKAAMPLNTGLPSKYAGGGYTVLSGPKSFAETIMPKMPGNESGEFPKTVVRTIPGQSTNLKIKNTFTQDEKDEAEAPDETAPKGAPPLMASDLVQEQEEVRAANVLPPKPQQIASLCQ